MLRRGGAAAASLPRAHLPAQGETDAPCSADGRSVGHPAALLSYPIPSYLGTYLPCPFFCVGVGARRRALSFALGRMRDLHTQKGGRCVG